MQVTLTEAAQIAAQCSVGKSMFMHVRSHGPFGTLQVRASHSCLLSDLIEATILKTHFTLPSRLRGFQTWAPEMETSADGCQH
jgi:hypothetical protein